MAVTADRTAFAERFGCRVVDGFGSTESGVAITRTPDTPDDAWPFVDTSVMHDALVMAKGGDENSIVMIGVVSYGDTSCVCPWCCPGWGCMALNDNAIELVESFGDHGVLASVCEADYAPVLAETIDTIDATCAGFVPPG